jgi:class 3 adenylate cyclase
LRALTASPLPRVNAAEGASSTHHGRVVKRTGDGLLVEFGSVVDQVRCAIEIQNGMVMRNAGLPPERPIEFRVEIHLGDMLSSRASPCNRPPITSTTTQASGRCCPGS